MADNNTPDWVLDAQAFANIFREEDEKPFKEKYKNFPKRSITFDPVAQANLPQEIKDKMKSDREKTTKKT